MNDKKGSIGVNAFDENENTAFVMDTYPYEYEASVLIDKELWEKKIEVNILYWYASRGGNGVNLVFLNNIDQIIGEGIYIRNPSYPGEPTHLIKQILVPEGTQKMKVYYGEYQGKVNINEIRVVNEPFINNKPKYSKITNQRIEKGYSSVSIDYFVTSIQRLYKIDDGEWEEYTGTINIEEGKNIYMQKV
ncbi:MAG: hypothetical protein HFJ59_06375 [Clostridia bacterium]|nr:hypothetical protein [Clostridia bacterium]